MDERTDRDSDAVVAETVSRLCYWLIKSNFDIWNSASRASLTKMKEFIFRSLGHDRSSLLSSKSRWPAARPYAFPPIKKCCRWCYERSGWSEHQ